MHQESDVGTLRQMIKYATNFRRYSLSTIFITHLHVDHASGLAAVIADMGASRSSSGYFQIVHANDKERWCVNIYGPYHLASMFLPTLFYCKMDQLCDIHIHEFLTPGQELDSCSVSVNSNLDISSFQSPNVTVSAIYPDDDGYWTCFNVEIC